MYQTKTNMTEEPFVKSNFQMMKELLDQYHPEHSGYSTHAEVELINKTLCIPERNLTSLQNLRDFAVMYLSNLYDRSEADKREEAWDMMSAITAVIDMAKVRKGGSV